MSSTLTQKKNKATSAEEMQQFLIQGAREDFGSFCYFIDANYASNRHLDLLHNKLMRIEKGISKRDQTFMPPQHGKTLTASIYFAAWYLGKHPDHKIIFATYSQDLANLRGSEIREVMLRPEFQILFPDCVINRDTNAKDEFSFTRGGSLVALGRKAGGTGRSANGFILDDITKDQADADSAANRLEVKNFYSGVVMTRLVNKSWIHIINTRWHEDDLSGWTLSEHAHAGWDVLTLTAICEDETDDPCGRKVGEALWPEQQDEALLADKKASSTARQWAAIYQQTPVPDGGGTFKTEDWKTIDEVRAPGELPFFVLQSYDTAQKKGSKNDYTACVTLHLYRRGIAVVHVLRKRVLATDLKNLVHGHAANYSPNLILIEDKSSGTQLIQTLKGDTQLPILAINPTMEKELRMELAAMVMRARSVAIPPEGSFEGATEFRTELATVPASKFDDQADALTQALLWYDEFVRKSGAVIIKSGKPRFANQLKGFN